MKKAKALSIIIALIMLFVAAVPASAQLGDTDTSSITIQNISGATATVQVTFINEAGTSYTPNPLRDTPALANPFTLAANETVKFNVSAVPGLPSGRYSVVISSSEQVIAVAGVAGTGTTRFTGGYSGFSSGSGSLNSYMPVANYNWYGWYSMISVQNLGASPADITLTINCRNTPAVGTLTQLDVPANASHTFVLKDTVPSGFTAATECNGSAVVSSDYPVVTVNNQNKPAVGNTISYEGAPTGTDTLYVMNLQSGHYGWNSSLNIRKLSSGSTTVTIDYSDGEPNDTCNLTDAAPACNLYMPTHHPTTGAFAAKITSSPAATLMAVVGSTKGTLSGAISGVSGGTDTVRIANVQKYYYNWITSISCQNVSTVPTTIHISYEDYTGDAYTNPTSLSEGDTLKWLIVNEAFLPAGYQGSATITANAASAEISCSVGLSNPTNLGVLPGDWTNQYNAFSQ
jgi:hypothetical protein